MKLRSGALKRRSVRVRIMILEDDPLIALDLQWIVEECGHEVVEICESLADARRAMSRPIDFALLDVDLPDGKSFEVAATLNSAHVPFAFVSGSRRCDLPDYLSHAPFVAKPYAHAAIRNSLRLGRQVAC